MKRIPLILVAIIFCLNTIHVSGSEKSESSEFNVNEMIFDHIQDSHSWHICDITNKNGEKHAISVPLPVILIFDGHLDIFLSSKFHHGEHPVTIEDRTYTLHHNEIYSTNTIGELEYNSTEEGDVIANKKPLDFSITKNVVSLFLSAFILLLVFISVGRAYKSNKGAPKGLQAFMEPLVIFVKDEIAIPNIGEHKYSKFLPYLLTVFFFILINNLLGLVPFFPGGANLTGNIAVTLLLAACTMIITNTNGNKNYWKHIFMPPGVPIWILPIMIPIELIGVISKPFALTVRLFANITAGHIIVLSLISLIFILKTIFIAPVAVIFVLFMDCVELLVAFLQAYIFTMLSALFIGMAVEEAH